MPITLGSLNNDAHKVTLDYRSPVKTDHTVSSELERVRWMNRAMTVIICETCCHLHYCR